MCPKRRKWFVSTRYELKHEMRREGVTPNLWMFHKMGIYVNMVGEHQLDYNKRGPEANSNRERDKKYIQRSSSI